MTEETHSGRAQRPARHRDVDRGVAVRGLGPADRRSPSPSSTTPPRWPRRPASRRSRSSSTPSGATTAKVLLLVVIGAQLFCGMSSVTANSRMIYAFSRDGALPGSNIWHRVNKRTRTPTNAIWLAAAGALILGLPYLWNTYRLRGGHLDRDDRPVHRLRRAHLPAAAPGRGVPARPLAPGPVELRGRLDRGHLGGLHHDPVHAARGEPDHLHDLQLRHRRRAGGHRLRRHLLAGLGPQMVQGAAGPGHRRRSWPPSSRNWPADGCSPRAGSLGRTKGKATDSARLRQCQAARNAHAWSNCGSR